MSFSSSSLFRMAIPSSIVAITPWEGVSAITAPRACSLRQAFLPSLRVVCFQNPLMQGGYVTIKYSGGISPVRR